MWSFMKRHNLSLRSPEATTLGRATSFNRATVGVFFKNISDIMDRYHFSPENIYNMDDTGCFTTQTPLKVIALKGAEQVGAVTSAERGSLVTMIGTINAIGNTVPPYFIFPRSRFVKESMLAGAPVGSTGFAAKSEWINEEIFVKYLKHFIQFTKCCTENPVLLIMDNHASHISLTPSLMGRKHGIVMVTIHPHTSHKLQSLDRTVYGPFKRYYKAALDNWMRENPATTLSIYGVAQLAKQAFELAFTPRNILSGFRCSGICPLKPNVFTNDDFAPSAITARLPVASTTDLNSSSVERTEELLPAEKDLDELNDTCEEASSNGPETETTVLTVSLTANERVNDSNSFATAPICSETPESGVSGVAYKSTRDILPLSKASERRQTNRKRKGRSLILTDTPEKNRFEKKAKEREIKSGKKRKVSQKKTTKKNLSKKTQSKSIVSSEFFRRV